MKQWMPLLLAIPLICAAPWPQSSNDQPENPAVVASISSAVSSASLKPYATPLATDQITEWTAIGDSYTAGVGSNGLDDVIPVSQSCSRYKKAYPMQMNSNTSWPGNQQDRKINFGACTGDVMSDVLKKQVRVYL